MNRRRMAPKYNPLDDVPHSVRQNLAQPSPCYSIVTDSGSADGPPQTQDVLIFRTSRPCQSHEQK